MSKIAIWLPLLRLNPPTEDFPLDDLGKIFRGCQLGMLKSFFFWYSILGTKNSIFFRLSFISRREKLVQTSVKYEWWVRLCAVNALTFRWWSHLLLGLAILSSCVCSSSGAFLQQPLFGKYKLWHAEQSPAQVSWINDCCDDVQAYGETKQTSKGIPPPTCYVVVQLISRANACRYHRRVNWKRHTESWNLTLIDETGSVFSRNKSKPPIARSQFRRAIRIPALVGVVAAAVSIKGMIVVRWGEGN